VHAAELCDACSALGDASLAKGRTEDAIAAYRESIDLSSSSAARARAWPRLAASLRIGDRYDEALAGTRSCRAGRRRRPGSEPARTTLTLRGNLHFRAASSTPVSTLTSVREFAEQAGSIEGTHARWAGWRCAYQRGRMQTARRLFAECSSAASSTAHGLRLAYLPMAP
jgi:tetratricopeptide (TPR) repeat protein